MTVPWAAHRAVHPDLWAAIAAASEDALRDPDFLFECLLEVHSTFPAPTSSASPIDVVRALVKLRPFINRAGIAHLSRDKDVAVDLVTSARMDELIAAWKESKS